MKRWVLAAATAVVLAAAGCMHTAAVSTMKQTAGGLVVNMETQPSPPHTGDNTLILTITDETSGAPVGNANVKVTADMTAPNIPGMEVSGRAQGNGRYEAPVRLALATRYNVNVRIDRTGHSATNMVFSIEPPR